MSEEIKVTVVEFSDRKFYLMQWRCPFTGKKCTLSTKVPRTGKKADRKQAERVAGEHETALRNGQYKPASKVTWSEFRTRYENEVLDGKSDGTFSKVSGVFNSVESILNLADETRLATINAGRLSYYQSELRKGGRSEDTIRGHLAHLSAAFKWGVRMKVLREAPSLEMPSGAGKSMKGRPITGEEFDRMLDKVEDGLIAAGHKPRKSDGKPAKRQLSPEAVEKRRADQRARAAAVAPSWRRLLRGLWFSGLRLGEALDLYWDRDDRLRVDLGGRRPMLWIPGKLQKNGKDTLLPITPDFAEFLLATPEAERTGPVFNLALRSKDRRPSLNQVSRAISKMGEKAGIKVATDAETGEVKYASAHDLRRSFGERWAARLMPAQLKELMRHDSIETTMKFYVGANAERTADAVWAAFEKSQPSGNTFGNTRQNSAAAERPEIDVNPCEDSMRAPGLEPGTYGLKVPPEVS